MKKDIYILTIILLFVCGFGKTGYGQYVVHFETSPDGDATNEGEEFQTFTDQSGLFECYYDNIGDGAPSELMLYSSYYNGTYGGVLGLGQFILKTIDGRPFGASSLTIQTYTDIEMVGYKDGEKVTGNPDVIDADQLTSVYFSGRIDIEEAWLDIDEIRLRPYDFEAPDINYGQIAVSVTAVAINVYPLPTVAEEQIFSAQKDAAVNTVIGTIQKEYWSTIDDREYLETMTLVNFDTPSSTWSIVSGNDENIFGINNSTGELYVADETALASGSATTYSLMLTVDDGYNTSVEERVFININEAGDNVVPTQNFHIDEDADNNAILGTVEGSSLSNWLITAGNEDGIFQIDNSSGELSVLDNTNLDEETNNYYVLTLTADDGTTTSTIKVNVIINDINDNTPVITASQTIDIDENTIGVFGSVIATDADNDTLSWTIIAGNDDGFFQIDSLTGKLSSTVSFDAETNAASYSLTLTVSDGIYTSNSEIITINLNDVNEYTPTINSSQSFNFDEDETTGYIIGTPTTNDLDITSLPLTWSILVNNEDGIFGIDSSSGELYIADDTNLGIEESTTADFEYNLIIQISDGINSSHETVEIIINDLNDTEPFIHDFQSFILNEGINNDEAFGTVTADDYDVSRTTFSNWTIISGNEDGAYQLDSNSGQLSVLDVTKLDFETTNSDVLTLTVSDGLHTSEEETIIINIIPLTPPVIDSDQTFSVAEDFAYSQVASVFAEDINEDQLSDWTITSGNEDGFFQILVYYGDAYNEASISVTDSAKLDAETQSIYTLGITVSDGTFTSEEETVTITITDVNDNIPIITANQILNVSEGAANEAVIGSIAVTDQDITETTFSDWTITAGNDEGIFQVDSNTGELSVADNSPLNSETTSSYTLTLTVSDGVNSSEEATVIINITDANDVAPVITAGQTFIVAVDAENGTELGSVEATDKDIEETTFDNWTITAGNDDGIFQINSSSGILSVSDNSNLGASAGNYTLTLSVSDGINTSDTETIVIVSNDKPYINNSQSFYINENDKNNTTIGTIIAVDANDDTLSEWLIVSGNEDGVFQLDSNNGTLSIADSTTIDAETTTSYTLNITVSDGTNTSNEQSINILVTDVNDISPIINSNQEFSVNEGATNETIFGTLAATDQDITETTFSDWSITSGNDDGAFQIDSDSGVLSVADSTKLASSPYEGYSLGVTVSDGVNISPEEFISVTVNGKPVVNGYIDPQLIEVGENYSMTLPSELFKGKNSQDVLTLSATSSTSPWPSWLNVDWDNETFSGTPTSDDIGNFFIELEAKNQSGLIASTEFEIITYQSSSYNLTGTLYSGDEPLSRGLRVSLFRVINENLDAYTLNTRTTNSSSGDFGFYNLEEGKYIIEAAIDDDAYSDLLTTYYNGTNFWTEATSIELANDQNQHVNIYMLEKPEFGVGNNRISGTITLMGVVAGSEKAGKILKNSIIEDTEEGEPIERVTLILEYEGEVIGTTQTDENGNYEFNNLPEGNFQLSVVLPGFTQSAPIEVTINENSQTEEPLVNFTAWEGSNSITDIDEIKIKDSVKVFPNPTDGKFEIDITSSPVGNIVISISNISGQVILNKIFPYKNKINIDISDQYPGVYFVKTSTRNTKSIKKIILF